MIPEVLPEKSSLLVRDATTSPDVDAAAGTDLYRSPADAVGVFDDVGDDDVFCDDDVVDAASRRSNGKFISAKRRHSSSGNSDCSDDDNDENLGMPASDASWPTIRVRLLSQLRFSSAERSDVEHSAVEQCRDFRLKRVLGSGGFGRVYLADSSPTSVLAATDAGKEPIDEFASSAGMSTGRRRRRRRGSRPVVVKLLSARKTASSTGCAVPTAVMDSFRSEANAIGLEHPNVSRVIAVGWTTRTAANWDDLMSVTDDRRGESSPFRKWSAGAVDQLRSAAMTDRSTAAVVMEFAGSRTLQSVVDDVSESMDFRRRVRYAFGISCGLSYIHSKGVAHLDLKPANVIVGAFDDRCKLIDFGCSSRSPSTSCLDHDDRLFPVPSPSASSGGSGNGSSRSTRASIVAAGRGGGGTLHYRAPELLSPRSSSSSFPASSGTSDSLPVKADVYSFGVTLWQMSARRAPYDGMFDSPLAVAYNVVKYNARPDGTSCSPYRPQVSLVESPSDAPDGLESWYRTIYVRCWNGEPVKRPTADELASVFERILRRKATTTSSPRKLARSRRNEKPIEE